MLLTWSSTIIKPMITVTVCAADINCPHTRMHVVYATHCKCKSSHATKPCSETQLTHTNTQTKGMNAAVNKQIDCKNQIQSHDLRYSRGSKLVCVWVDFMAIIHHIFHQNQVWMAGLAFNPIDWFSCWNVCALLHILPMLCLYNYDVYEL